MSRIDGRNTRKLTVLYGDSEPVHRTRQLQGGSADGTGTPPYYATVQPRNTAYGGQPHIM
jgi:hypothetical protein